MASCKTCRFWHQERTGGTFCRRYPAAVFPFPGADGISCMSFWPPMEAASWCGEYRAAPLPPPTGVTVVPSKVTNFPVPGDGSQKLP